MINAFLADSVSVASWDKPGVGASDGNWLSQSMDDRATETIAVLQWLRNQHDADTPIAVLGFSQAGWVLPKLTRGTADRLILVGPALNWTDQGRYFTETRLALAGVSESEKVAALAAQPDLTSQPMDVSDDRWTFIITNNAADSSNDLASLDIPLLAIWGAADLNVNPVANETAFRQIASRHGTPLETVLWPDATHSLLKSRPYNWQLASQWSAWAQFRFLLEGRSAFAPGALSKITDWAAIRQ